MRVSVGITFAEIDECDFQIVQSLKWRLSTGGYAIANPYINGKQPTIYMHRLIINAGAGQIVDHRDGNKLNNIRSNLRLCTMAQNMQNRAKTISNSSGFKGVTVANKKGDWRADIYVNGRRIYLGSFPVAEEAYRVYLAAAAALHGEFAHP